MTTEESCKDFFIRKPKLNSKAHSSLVSEKRCSRKQAMQVKLHLL